MLISDSGQKANVGVIFHERNDSFDFLNGIEEFKKLLNDAKGKSKVDKSSADLSLKEGEKMTLKIKGI